MCQYRNINFRKFDRVLKIAMVGITMTLLAACKDDKDKNEVVDKPTILTAPIYTKSEIALADSTILKIEAKESGIKDEDGVENTIYKMVGTLKDCDTTNKRISYIEHEYTASNGGFEIEIPKSCGYQYYFFAEADVVEWQCSGGNVHNFYKSIVHKRSYVVNLTNQKDEVMINDPFSFSINVPHTTNCY